MKPGFASWLRFNAVGIVGVVVQLVLLWVFKSRLGWSVRVSTVLAVECTVLHNFVWHERWTWAHRRLEMSGIPGRLLRFNVSNGLISIVGNLVLMEALAVRLHLNYMLANIAAIITCSLVNYFVSDKLVFKSGEVGSRIAARAPRSGAGKVAGGKREARNPRLKRHPNSRAPQAREETRGTH